MAVNIGFAPLRFSRIYPFKLKKLNHKIVVMLSLFWALPILENLKCDESEYVRKSVANNLSDISKDNPEIVLDLLAKWQGEVSERLTKHALRTLLKKRRPARFKAHWH